MGASADQSTLLGIVEIPAKTGLAVLQVSGLELPIRPAGKSGPDPALGVVTVTGKTDGKHYLLSLDLGKAKTGWLLLCTPGETLDPAGLDQALAVLAKASKKPLLVTVKERLSPALLERYEWAGTRGVFTNPQDAVSTVYCQEPRLLPVSGHKAKPVKIRMPEHSGQAFVVQGLSPAIKMKVAPLALDRAPLEKRPESKKPGDQEMFSKGHFRYYKDEEFCPRFVWPPSMYLLIRKPHIPGIIRGMEQGLGNTEILSYALNYLTMTGDFESAEKLVPLTPDHWFVQSPMLAQVCGAVLTMRGKMDEAVRYFEKARELDQEDSAAMFNLGKMYLVTGRKDRAREVFAKCLEDSDLPEEQRSGVKFFLQAMDSGGGGDTRLSLCMIVRDEEEALPRALASVSGLVDEMLVVDTGSSDATRQIALDAGARVLDYPWDDDFSAARNFAMDQAAGDFVFFLDADERLSPFHRINLIFLKMLLSRESPRAYELSIGRTDVTTDWLIISALPDNFIKQTTAIRILPRLPEIRFAGRAAESASDSLSSLQIPVTTIPPGQLDIIHDEFGRERRVLRKSGAYDRTEFPSLALAATAVQDYSSIRDEQHSVRWLKTLQQFHPGQSENWRLLLRLAIMMEDTDPDFALKTYRQLLEEGNSPPPVINALASFLVRKNDFDSLASLDLDATDCSFANAAEEKTFQTHQALVRLAKQDVSGAAEFLEKVLDADHGFILAQAARFFLLSVLGISEGALPTLDDLAFLLRQEGDVGQETSLDFMHNIEAIARTLEKSGYMEARSLVLNGAVFLVSGQEAT